MQCGLEVEAHKGAGEFDNDDNDGLQKDVVSAMMEGLSSSLSLSLTLVLPHRDCHQEHLA